jgi:Methyltransferase domain
MYPPPGMSTLENKPQPLLSDPPIDILRDSPWQMSYGERAALEGLLSQAKPALAIEIGTAEGGSLERIAHHSQEVHSFDLVEPDPAARGHANLTFHTGDSHVLLPQLLHELAAEDRAVDFVLVDGDHSSEGVRRDIEDLLNSPATGNTLIVLHDTANEVVRTGIEQVTFDAWPKVAYVELDFVTGYVFREPTLFGEMWGGLGLIVTHGGPKPSGAGAVQTRYFETGKLLRHARPSILAAARSDAQREKLRREIADIDPSIEFEDIAEQRDQLRAELDEMQLSRDRLQFTLNSTVSSFSWKITRPLRGAKARFRRLVS